MSLGASLVMHCASGSAQRRAPVKRDVLDGLRRLPYGDWRLRHTSVLMGKNRNGELITRIVRGFNSGA